MTARVPVNLPDGLKQTVSTFGGLNVARKLYGPQHPYVLDRAAKVVTKFMRNYTGMAHVYRRIIYDMYEVPVEGVPLRRRTWFWPRNYYFTYPNEFVSRWHQPHSDWKRHVMRKYCTNAQMSRTISRYELFCILKKMHERDILDMGW